MVEKILCVCAVLGQLYKVPMALYEEHIFIEQRQRTLYSTALKYLQDAQLVTVQQDTELKYWTFR